MPKVLLIAVAVVVAVVVLGVEGREGVHHSAGIGPLSYKPLGNFSITNSAFVNAKRFNSSYPYDLFITTFTGNPFEDGGIYYVPNIAQQLTSFGSINPTMIDSNIWPNEAAPVPYEVFNKPVLAVGSGFLVPGKSTGAVTLYDFSTSPPSGPYKISTDRSEWFYHMTLWYDINGDGLIDCLTARAIVPIVYGNRRGQLLWLEHPASNALSNNPWKEHILTDGPDVFFKLVNLPGLKQPAVLAAQFFTSKLALYWTDGSWATSPVQSRVIDASIGPPFDISIVDLNADGKSDVLFTNHDDQAQISGVYGYEIPTNWKTATWTRHTIANGFKTLEGGPNQASPGKAQAIHPTSKYPLTEKPLILLGGDGSQMAYMIVPLSSSPSNWSYNTTVIINLGGTVGQVSAADVTGSGRTTFFVPNYDDGLVYGYQY